ncbi:hypothetical protein K491DRAFT_347896 [Lophiostoma macrostomum CBS 122681]|uniref:Secreted protein n=1 Tax=Lophiostoma macrostomum CBS 122681 TaxID=1314788 RepID=A0A6A6TAM7_9PLEO|nr:hypothetical protein K491DRAFT_347896 [Lophiostoma macrostomum CBS 122681]
MALLILPVLLLLGLPYSPGCHILTWHRMTVSVSRAERLSFRSLANTRCQLARLAPKRLILFYSIGLRRLPLYHSPLWCD